MAEHTFIIAEFGSCHDNSFANVLRGVQVAKQAGADAFKLQYWSDPKRLAERRNADAYFPIYSRYQIPDEWLKLAAQECKSSGLEFMCTTYLPEDIKKVAPYVSRFKVASFEAGDEEFLRAHRPFSENYRGKEIIISTGMMCEGQDGEDEDSFEFKWREGFLNSLSGGVRYSLLHCVSAYPTPLEQANLGVLGPDSNWAAGYSDHTRNILTGAFAVCAGARILEVHFRLHDTDPANPDYATALSPGELAEYVTLVRTAEKMLGDGVKRLQECEAEMSKYRVGGA